MSVETREHPATNPLISITYLPTHILHCILYALRTYVRTYVCTNIATCYSGFQVCCWRPSLKRVGISATWNANIKCDHVSDVVGNNRLRIVIAVILLLFYWPYLDSKRFALIMNNTDYDFIFISTQDILVIPNSQLNYKPNLVVKIPWI